jgi:glycosyltransferase involved in cell wall biosynthesis
MRIVVEVPSAEFGGIRTYVENLLAAWAEHHPRDDLLVVLPQGSDLALSGHGRHDLAVRRPAAFTRPLVQTWELPRVLRRFGADAVLSVMPSTTLRRLEVPHAVVVHDLRHELRPDQFTPAQRLLRRVAYSRAYGVADGLISVSRRTEDDLLDRHPSLTGKQHVVVHHGADHVLHWPPGDHRGPAIAFGHHTNKNPELILEGWAEGSSRGLDLPDVLIVGTGSARSRLHEQAAERGLRDHVRVAPYLSDEEFRRAMAAASMVIMTSDFEGFGLPVVEGMLLGARVVIGPEKAMLEVAGGHAAVLTDWTPAALAGAVHRAAGFDVDHLERARAHAARFTWERCVEQTRDFLGRLSSKA